MHKSLVIDCDKIGMVDAQNILFPPIVYNHETHRREIFESKKGR